MTDHIYKHQAVSGNIVTGKFTIPERGHSADFETSWCYSPSDEDKREYYKWCVCVLNDLSEIAGRKLRFKFYGDHSTREPMAMT